MEILKRLSIGAIFAIIIFGAQSINDDNNLIFKIIVVTFFIIFILSVALRRFTWFQPYYTSKYNILTSKYKKQIETDFSKNILFHKMIEVVSNARFRIISYNEEKGEILAASSISWLSWGENINISIEKLGDKTIMNFCSASLFGIYSWGKNEYNYSRIMSSF